MMLILQEIYPDMLWNYVLCERHINRTAIELQVMPTKIFISVFTYEI